MSALVRLLHGVFVSDGLCALQTTTEAMAVATTTTTTVRLSFASDSTCFALLCLCCCSCQYCRALDLHARLSKNQLPQVCAGMIPDALGCFLQTTTAAGDQARTIVRPPLHTSCHRLSNPCTSDVNFTRASAATQLVMLGRC